MRSVRSAVITGTCVAAALSGLALAVPTSASAASASPRTPASWHKSLSVSNADFPEFSAVTSWTANGAWAFASQDSNGTPRAYQLSGGTWHRDSSFPGLRGEQIWSATSSSASNVWAFTVTRSSKERVLRYNGHAWSVVPTSGKLINSGLALSSRDVWIFGAKFGFSTGTVHYDGTKFTRFGSGAGLFGGSALSSKNIWAYGVNKVAHWNGSTWKSTSVAGLLSKSCGNVGFLEGIFAISSSDVIAVGAGGCSDNHGPLILLRFNGTSWHRLTITKPISANPLTIIGDGSGGAWIPVLTGAADLSSAIYHFTGHSIGKASLPVSSKFLELDGATIAKGSAKALAFGFSRNAADTHWTGRVLRFESTGAAAAAPAAAGWHVTKTVAGPSFQEFTSATAASGTSAWAFESGGAITKPRAYRLSGHTWSARAFPSQAGEQVFSTSSSSPSNVWAFTITENSTSRVLRYNGHSWKQVKTFGQLIGTGLAIGSKDVWVFGEPFRPALGTVHFNGHRWIKVGGGVLLGASALSANSIWAYGPASVAHWNGGSWHRTSVARLLPKSSQVCGAGFLSGIAALSAKNVYAVGAGGCPDGQGPLVLLHFDGKSWHRVAIKTLHADPEAVISDGSGGVWIPLVTGAPPSSTMYHFAHGTLTRVRLPISPAHLDFFGAAIGKHTTAALAFGLTRKSFAASKSTAVMMRFGS